MTVKSDLARGFLRHKADECDEAATRRESEAQQLRDEADSVAKIAAKLRADAEQLRDEIAAPTSEEDAA
jgi:hypothetical protein